MDSNFSHLLDEADEHGNSGILRPSPCSEDEIEIFTTGDCWKLAHELHIRGVGKLVGVVAADNPNNWCHMLIELEGGLFLDAFGIQSREQVLGRWSEWVALQFDRRAVVASYNLSDPNRWHSLVFDQDQNLTDHEEVVAVADKLVGWINDLS